MDMIADHRADRPAVPQLDDADRALIAVVQGGFPLVSRPYAAVGAAIGLDEQEVIERLKHLMNCGAIKRMGVVVRHRELGYCANAMVVWDVPDTRVAELGHWFSQFEFITLCYRRPRRLPDWPYNLFCMIHGRDRDVVLQNLSHLIERCGVHGLPREVLFSRRRFKQRGALYLADGPHASAPARGGPLP
jgi:DNA-binding Lrp family transcriptional regulator